MNILHINMNDTYGGAGLAAYRLHRTLIRFNEASTLFVGKKFSHDSTVDLFPQKYRFSFIAKKLSEFTGLNYAFLPRVPLEKKFNTTNFDVVHLHNLHTGYINYRHLNHYFLNKKVFLTLHDEWAYTGHCSYTRGCERFEVGCGRCPHLDTYPSVRRDATATEWKWKHLVFARLNPVVICPSRWIEQRVARSLLKYLRRIVIPHGVELEVFKPVDRDEAKRALGITPSALVIGFGAHDTEDRRKGGDVVREVVKALLSEGLSISKSVRVLLVGKADAESWANKTGVPTFATGYLEDGPLKSLAYSACDVFLVPSREEIFGLMALEAQACGVPVIASMAGGLPEIVSDSETGFVADNDTDFIRKSLELARNEHLRLRFSKQARRRIENMFDIREIARRHLELYRNS